MIFLIEEWIFLMLFFGYEFILIEGMFFVSLEWFFWVFIVLEDVFGWFLLKGNVVFQVEIDFQVGGKWWFVLEKINEKQVWFEGEYLVIDCFNCLDFSWWYVVEFVDGKCEVMDSFRVFVLFLVFGVVIEVKLYYEVIKIESVCFNVGDGWSGCFMWLDGYVIGQVKVCSCEVKFY